MKINELNIETCKSYKADTETCKSGCKNIDVAKGNACPFDGKPTGKECPCYMS